MKIVAKGRKERKEKGIKKNINKKDRLREKTIMTIRWARNEQNINVMWLVNKWRERDRRKGRRKSHKKIMNSSWERGKGVTHVLRKEDEGKADRKLVNWVEGAGRRRRRNADFISYTECNRLNATDWKQQTESKLSIGVLEKGCKASIFLHSYWDRCRCLSCPLW